MFNLINARKLGEREFNVFSNFCNNWKFFIVFGIILYGQILMVRYGGEIVRAAPLSNEQQLFCTGIGAFSLIWGALIKIILPASLFGSLAINEVEMTEKAE